MSLKTTIIRGLLALERPDADEIADDIMDGTLLVVHRDELPAIAPPVEEVQQRATGAEAYQAAVQEWDQTPVANVPELTTQPPVAQTPVAPPAPPAPSGKKRRSLDEIVSDTAAEYDVEFTLGDVREWAHPNKVTAKLIEGYAQGLQSAKVEQAVAVPTQPGDPFVAAPVQQEAPAPVQQEAPAPVAAPQQPQFQAPAPFPGELPEGIEVYQPESEAAPAAAPKAPWEM